MKAAIRNGGTHLDHFDGFLSDFYKSLGFGKLRSIYSEVPVIYRKLKGIS